MVTDKINFLFSGFFRNHSSIILIIDTETLLIEYANNSALEFYGYSYDEITSMNISEINTMTFEEIKQVFESISVGKKLDNIRHILKNGEIRYVNLNADKITINNRDYIFEIINDVTEEKKILSQFKKDRDLFNKGPVVSIVWKYEAGWPVSHVSENIKNVLGYDKNYILNENFKYADIIHPEDLQKIKTELTDNINDNEDSHFYECRLKHKNGNFINILHFADIIRDNAGSIKEITGYFYDQGYCQSLQKWLDSKNKQLEHLIESAYLGTWLWDIQTNELIVNEIYAEMLGYTLEEISPFSFKTWHKLCHPEDFNKSYRLINMHVKGELPYYECEIRLKCKNSDYKWILDKGKVIEFDENNKPVLMSGVHIDIDKIKKLEEELKRYLNYFNLAQKASKTGTWCVNFTNDDHWWSDETYNIFGVTPGKVMSSADFIDLVYDEDKEFVIESMNKALKGEKYDIEHRILVEDKIKWLSEKADIIFDEDNNPIEIIGTVRDITVEKELLNKIENENNIITLLFDLLPDYVYFIDNKQTIVRQNKNAQKRFDSKIGEKCYMSIFKNRHIHDEHKKLIKEGKNVSGIKCNFCLFEKALKNHTQYSKEFEDDGRFYKVWWIPVNDNEYLHYFIDITDLKIIEQDLKELSVKDHLTKIYNRRYFSEVLEMEIELHKRNKKQFSLIMYDIDHFKKINDTYGHNVGDDVLKAITDIVKGRIRTIDVFARWGGEEFLILLPDTNVLSASVLAEELRLMIENTEIIKGEKITASFGVTEFRSGDTFEIFINRVDKLMYQAKQSGRNKVVSDSKDYIF